MNTEQAGAPRLRARTVAGVMRDIHNTTKELCRLYDIGYSLALTKAVILAEAAYGIDMTAIKSIVCPMPKKGERA